jgi:hypothetical protein
MKGVVDFMRLDAGRLAKISKKEKKEGRKDAG